MGKIQMRAGWCFKAAHIPGVKAGLAHFTFLGGLAEKTFANYLPFTRTRKVRRRAWGRVVERRVRISYSFSGDGRSSSFDRRHLSSCLAFSDAVSFGCRVQILEA